MNAPHFMNPMHGMHMMEGRKAMKSETDAAHGSEHGSKSAKGTHIHFHGHSKGVTAHIMHHDGKHEKHEHAHGDVEGMKAHMDEHFGSGTPEPEAEPPEAMPEEEPPTY